MVDCRMRRACSGVVRAGLARGMLVRGSIVGGVLLLVACVHLGGPSTGARVAAAQTAMPAPGIEMTTLATRRLDEVPSGRRWVLRRNHPLNEDAHAHAGGFIYATQGATYLVVEDSQGSLMQEGQAAWAPEGIGHLHTSAYRASSSGRSEDAASQEIWTILLEREAESRRPGAAAISPLLRGLLPGAYEARLVAMTFQPGAETALRSRTGPELAYTLDGFWELEYAGVPLPLGASQGYLADPGVPHRLRNIGTTPARLLSAQLVPAGQPAEEPVPEASS
jgi:quercetin dioxygenase-like cupin family protein